MWFLPGAEMQMILPFIREDRVEVALTGDVILGMASYEWPGEPVPWSHTRCWQKTTNSFWTHQVGDGPEVGCWNLAPGTRGLETQIWESPAHGRYLSPWERMRSQREKAQKDSCRNLEQDQRAFPESGNTSNAAERQNKTKTTKRPLVWQCGSHWNPE